LWYAIADKQSEAVSILRQGLALTRIVGETSPLRSKPLNKPYGLLTSIVESWVRVVPAAELAEEGGHMNHPANVAEIFTPERRAVLLDILLASGSTSINITVSQPYPETPEDILRKPTVDSIRITANFTMGAS
jgi:hypothetical protein